VHTGINELNNGCWPKPNLVTDEKGDLLADSHSFFNRWKDHFCQLLNSRGDSDVRQTEIHTTEPLVPESSASEIDMAIEMLKRYKAPRIG
jgi:hypothetical protein